jgi:hypothetical protein
MFLRSLPACIAPAILTISPTLVAEEPAGSLKILTTFDYPGEGFGTYPGEMNENGDVAGYYLDPDGLERGFVRYGDGSFSPPIVPPFGTGSYTAADDINNEGIICGFFSSPDDTVLHGYFLAGDSFTQFDIDGAISTFIAALTDSGDFGGYFETESTSEAYVSLGGALTSFSIPGASFTGVASMARSGEAIGNYRLGTETTNHGFIRTPAGELSFPIDFPGVLGPLGTIVRGLNNRGWIVGGYFDRQSIEHGFLSTKPGSFIAADVAGAGATRLTGITDHGLVCGSYVDTSSGRRRGFVAQIRRARALQ